jgi:glycosyltransferase involved in cell wall biosynthesis
VKKISIVHIVSGLNIGGIENWLVQSLDALPKDKFVVSFILTEDFFISSKNEVVSSVNENLVREHGCKIIRLRKGSFGIVSYLYELINCLKSEGPFDVVHSHTYLFSGVNLLAAKVAGIKSRIAHSHSNYTSLYKSFPKKAYQFLMRFLLTRIATFVFACSDQAGQSLLGVMWKKFYRKKVFPCFIDLSPFSRAFQQKMSRSQIGIHDENALVYGHIGRFVPAKNHDFLLDVFKELFIKDNNSYLVLIGEGPLRTRIQEKVEIISQEVSSDDVQFDKHVIFLGQRTDAPLLLTHCIDFFLFPSLQEGLGLVAVEAQATSTPVVMSDTIPEDAIVIKELCHRIPLNVHDWVTTIQKLLLHKPTKNYEYALQQIRNSTFNLETGSKTLREVYISQTT